MRRHLVAGLVTVGLLASSVGRAQEIAPSEVLVRMKAATGGDAWDGVRGLHRETKDVAGGLEGTGASWTDVLTGRYLETYAFGPLSGADGFDGTVVWSQDTSGQVRPEEGGEERIAVVNEAYRRCLGFWYPERRKGAIADGGERAEAGRRFRVLRLTPEGGRPYDLWVDTASWLPDRVVEVTASDTVTTFYSDYREVDGIRLPFAARSTNGLERYDSRTECTLVEVNPELDDAMFAMPAPPPPDFSFAGGATSTTVPFTLINNHIYLDVMLAGKGPYRLLCDTGGANVFTPTLARELGLEPEGALQGRGVGEGSEDMGLVMVPSLTIGDVTLENQLFYSVGMESFSDVAGVPFLGLVGYEVFRRFVVRIDYEGRRLTLTVPSAFTYHGDGTVVPFHFNGHIPQVDGSIDGVEGKFDLDTGSRGTLSLFGPFVKEHGLESRLPAGPECVTGWGVGGPVRSMLTRARLLRLGSVEVTDVVATISRQSKGSFTDPYVAGNVGGGVLKSFNLVFNYDAQTVIFERNGDRSAPGQFDRSGMWINRAPGGLKVMDVTPDGPADAAGIESGDLIISVDGRDAAEVSLPDLRERFRTDAPGTAVQLRVERGGTTLEVRLVLRDQI